MIAILLQVGKLSGSTSKHLRSTLIRVIAHEYTSQALTLRIRGGSRHQDYIILAFATISVQQVDRSTGSLSLFSVETFEVRTFGSTLSARECAGMMINRIGVGRVLMREPWIGWLDRIVVLHRRGSCVICEDGSGSSNMSTDSPQSRIHPNPSIYAEFTTTTHIHVATPSTHHRRGVDSGRSETTGAKTKRARMYPETPLLFKLGICGASRRVSGEADDIEQRISREGDLGTSRLDGIRWAG
jgi:hypothetical protein